MSHTIDREIIIASRLLALGEGADNASNREMLACEVSPVCKLFAISMGLDHLSPVFVDASAKHLPNIEGYCRSSVQHCT